jgi:hypothetical protein
MEAGGELEHAAIEHSAVDSRQVFENLMRAVISRKILLHMLICQKFCRPKP